MGADSEIGELLAKAAADLTEQAARFGAEQMRKPSPWRTALLIIATFGGSLIGGGYAFGRWMEHSSATLDDHARRVTTLEARREEDRAKLDQFSQVAIDGKRTAEIQCHRLDARWNERACP